MAFCNYDQKTLDKFAYDVSGVVVDNQQELKKFVANLMELGYTETKAKNILEGLLNDQSRSAGGFKTRFERKTLGNRQQQRSAVHSESDRGADNIGVNGRRNSRENGRRIPPGVATRTGGRTELNTDSQKADSTDGPAFSMLADDGQAYVSPSKHSDLFEQYEQGRITREEYQAEVRARDEAQAAEIRKLRQKNAAQQQSIEQLRSAFKSTHGGWSESKMLEVMRDIMKKAPKIGAFSFTY